jgi:hypothetical protein
MNIIKLESIDENKVLKNDNTLLGYVTGFNMKKEEEKRDNFVFDHYVKLYTSLKITFEEVESHYKNINENDFIDIKPKSVCTLHEKIFRFFVVIKNKLSYKLPEMVSRTFLVGLFDEVDPIYFYERQNVGFRKLLVTWYNERVN